MLATLTDFKDQESWAQWQPAAGSPAVQAPSFRGVWAGLTDDPKVGMVALDEDGNQLFAMVERDESGGIERVTGAIWAASEGDTIVTFFNGEGLPERMVIDGYQVLFSNYTADSVDITSIGPDGTVLQQIQGAPMDADAILAARTLSSGALLPKAVHSRLARYAAGWSLGDTFRFAGIAVGAAFCTAGAVISGPFAPVTLVACGSLVLNVASEIVRDQYPELAFTSTAVSAFIDGTSCIFGAMVHECIPFALTIAGAVASLGEAEEIASRPEPPVVASEPCTVRASTRNSVQVRVGPGENRSAIAWMPPNVDVDVYGYAQADDGSFWWQVDRDQAAPGSAANEAWIAQAGVETSGDCDTDAIEVAMAPPVIPIATEPPEPPPSSSSSSSSSSSGPIRTADYEIWFRADRTSLNAGECTFVRWDLEGIDSVYYNGYPAVGHSESYECPTSTTTYELRVLLRNGQTRYEYVTVYIGGGAPSGGTSGGGTTVQLGTGDVQVTVQWNTAADVDLHVRDPYGELIYYGDPTSASGGRLDVDSNFPCGTNMFYVENVYWPSGRAPAGTYQVLVDVLSLCGGGTPTWTLTARVNGAVVLTRSGSGDSSWFSFSR
jgi:hypothetical protein